MSIFVYYVIIDATYTGAVWNETLDHFVCPGDTTGGTRVTASPGTRC